MKKTLTLLLALLLTLSTLTACSTNEVTMLKIVNDMLNVETGEISGELFLTTPHAMEIGFEGEFNLENIQKPYLNLKIDLDTRTPFARRLISGKIILDQEKFIISKDLVRTIKELKENKDYLTLFDKEYKDYEYLAFSTNELNNYLDLIEVFKKNLTIENITEISTNLKELKPLKMVHMEEGDLIEFKITPKNIEQATTTIVDYLIENQKDLAYETNSQITKNVVSNILKSAEDPEYLKNIFKKTDETDDDFNSTIRNFIRKYNSKYEETLAEKSKSFSDSYFSCFFGYNKYKKHFTYDLSFKVFNRKEKIDFKGSSNFIIKERKVNKVILNDDLIIDYFEVDVEKENSIPNRINISWKDNSNIATLYTHFKKYDNSKQYNANYYIIEDRIYLPLRQICELLGLEVSWDDIERKAYVTKGKNKVDMTGTIIGDRTFIKIRDFEKIGLTVSYTENGENKTASIIR